MKFENYTSKNYKLIQLVTDITSEPSKWDLSDDGIYKQLYYIPSQCSEFVQKL